MNWFMRDDNNGNDQGEFLGKEGSKGYKSFNSTYLDEIALENQELETTLKRGETQNCIEILRELKFNNLESFNNIQKHIDKLHAQLLRSTDQLPDTVKLRKTVKIADNMCRVYESTNNKNQILNKFLSQTNLDKDFFFDHIQHITGLENDSPEHNLLRSIKDKTDKEMYEIIGKEKDISLRNLAIQYWAKNSTHWGEILDVKYPELSNMLNTLFDYDNLPDAYVKAKFAEGKTESTEKFKSILGGLVRTGALPLPINNFFQIAKEWNEDNSRKNESEIYINNNIHNWAALASIALKDSSYFHSNGELNLNKISEENMEAAFGLKLLTKTLKIFTNIVRSRGNISSPNSVVHEKGLLCMLSTDHPLSGRWFQNLSNLKSYMASSELNLGMNHELWTTNHETITRIRCYSSNLKPFLDKIEEIYLNGGIIEDVREDV